MVLKFIWVKHGERISRRKVLESLQTFKPDVVGLELSDYSLEKLKQYKRRNESELFLAYTYAGRKGITVRLLDDPLFIKQLLDKLSFFSIILMFTKLCLINILRLFTGKRLKKLQIEDNESLYNEIVKKRDNYFSREIINLKKEFPEKKILLIFGKAHKKGILTNILNKE